MIGNPPYIQLQNNGGKLAKQYEGQEFKTFARTGDIYCLFYEKAYQLLRQGGICNFITSNKWMRAGYGQATRKFFLEFTNPLILIDFPGIKVFENATVDVNILLYAKEKCTFNTLACIVKDKELKELSLYVRQHGGKTTFSSDESWVILSEIEQRIKAKIEAIGTPLKEWDISINYGIKTGFNDAFIINGEKRAELIAQDPKSADIIRPILRGRDIKRYGYDFADLYLINTHNGVKEKGIKRIHIEDYPAVKAHLDLYYPQLEKRADQGDTPYNLRNCAYIEDFFKHKIIWKIIGNEIAFSIEKEGLMVNNACYLLTGEHLEYIVAFLNSKPIKWFSIQTNMNKTGVGDMQIGAQNIVIFPIPMPQAKYEKIIIDLFENKEYQKIEQIIYELYGFSEEEIKFIENQK